ncbi:MAG: nuclear transport factor 2 family protein [Sphingomonadales bacterium]|nr:nuclear transport factor 2 family protein [Sphingomonadales bacterium]
MDEFVVADCGIRQLHARFVDAAWRQDPEEFGGCFTRDGEWKIGGMLFAGREAIADACVKLLGRCSHIQLIPAPHILEVNGQEAQGRHHMLEIARMNDGSTAMTIGIYHDRYAFEDGRWRYKQRFWSLKYRGPADLSGAWVPSPDYGAFPGGPALDEVTFTSLKPGEGK